MHGVQQVGFAHPVQAGKTIQPGRQEERLAFVIFKLGEFELGEVQERGCWMDAKVRFC